MIAKQPMLSIVVPTYNRCAALIRLVTSLRAAIDQVPDYKDAIEVIISNNASTDETCIFLETIKDEYFAIHNHPINMGAIYNINFCFLKATGRYAWVIGDDDLPRGALIPAVLDIIRSKTPDCIFASPEFCFNLAERIEEKGFSSVRVELMGKEIFAKKVSHLFTFISSVIVRKEVIPHHELNYLISKYSDSYLPSLVYSMLALKYGSIFAYIRSPSVLATANQTGAYPAYKTFGVSYPTIVSDILGEEEQMSITLIQDMVRWMLPGVAWNCRSGDSRYGSLSNYEEVRDLFGNYPSFWALIYPIARAPLPVAWLMFQCFRAARRMRGIVHRLSK